MRVVPILTSCHVRGFAPIRMLEYWNIGFKGFSSIIPSFHVKDLNRSPMKLPAASGQGIRSCKGVGHLMTPRKSLKEKIIIAIVFISNN